MKQPRQRLLVVVGAALIVVGTALVASALLTPGADPTHISLAAATDGRTIRVEGTTNLIDGSIVVCQFTHEDERVAENTLVRKAEVSDGSFECRDDVSGWPRGAVLIEVVFGLDWAPQPRHVVDRYGSTGERLEGPQVIVDSPGDPRVLIARGELEM